MDDPRNERHPRSGSTASSCRASGRSCRCSTPASCSATASGRGCACAAGHPAFLERHLDRLFDGRQGDRCSTSGAAASELTEAIYATLEANDMADGVHVRLMVTRGVKRTPYQDPRVTIGPATVVIIAEHKEPLPATVSDGITLFTIHVRRASPGHAGSEAQLALQAQRHHRLHPGVHRRRRRGADARPPRVRRDLQLDALLHRRRRRRRAGGAAPPTGATAWPGSRARTCSRSAARTGSRRARRRSA